MGSQTYRLHMSLLPVLQLVVLCGILVFLARQALHGLLAGNLFFLHLPELHAEAGEGFSRLLERLGPLRRARGRVERNCCSREPGWRKWRLPSAPPG